MARPRYIPSKRDLSKAWTVKKNGGKKKDICSRLKISGSQYELSKRAFQAYFRQRSTAEKFKVDVVGVSKAAHKNKKVNMKNGEVKLTVANVDLEVLQSYVVCGFTQEKIASLLGVSRTTYFDFLKNNPDVKRVVDNAVDDTLSDVYRNGLLKLCKKHKLPGIIHASYMGEIETKDIEKHYNPDLGAIRYLMANKLGWTSEPRPESTNNKGAILRMLDDINNGEEHQDDDKRNK